MTMTILLGLCVCWLLALIASLHVPLCDGLSAPAPMTEFSRRALLRRSFATTIAVPFTTLATDAANSNANANAVETNEELIDVYFGCGCFWHVQHEFVEAEKRY